jgi:energy-coupling factor transporter ATP-binding protein EcfA2
MRPKQQYKERYPGLQPFDKGQSTIFFGRDKETKDLFYKICLEKMVVLFGKSGLGKSSLLNAGVSPLLERNGYLPIRIRFTSGTQASSEPGSENLLIRDFILAFDGFHFKRKILYNKADPKLWEFIKATQFTELVKENVNPDLTVYFQNKRTEAEASRKLNQNITVTPVFIFDQFEEFFNHPVRHQQEFLSQLSEALHEETPHRILEWLTRKEPEERTTEEVEWHKQPAIKVVFALRSDKLALMQSVVSYIATVLGNRYELKALVPAQAEQAITGPAAKTDLGSEYVAPYSFEKNTLAEIVHELSGETNEIESSQLQIICNHIEQRVRNESGGNPVIVDKNIINPKEDFPLILDNFYETQLGKIEDPKNRELARKLIEDDLVIDGQRDSISKRKLNNTLNISEDLIEELLFTRLIREESTSRGTIYELSHDTLIAPVEKSKNRRLQSEKDKKREEEKILLAQEATKKDEELKERYKQLIKEIQLKEEAQLQKEELEILSKKVKSRGRWVFFLTASLLLLAIIGGAWLSIQLKKDNRSISTKLETKLKELNHKEDSLDKAIQSLLYKEDTLTKIKKLQLEILDNAYDDADIKKQQDPELNTIVDSLFKSNKVLWEKYKSDDKILSKDKKIELLKKYFTYDIKRTEIPIQKRKAIITKD